MQKAISDSSDDDSPLSLLKPNLTNTAYNTDHFSNIHTSHKPHSNTTLISKNIGTPSFQQNLSSLSQDSSIDSATSTKKGFPKKQHIMPLDHNQKNVIISTQNKKAISDSSDDDSPLSLLKPNLTNTAYNTDHFSNIHTSHKPHSNTTLISKNIGTPSFQQNLSSLSQDSSIDSATSTKKGFPKNQHIMPLDHNQKNVIISTQNKVTLVHNSKNILNSTQDSLPFDDFNNQLSSFNSIDKNSIHQSSNVLNNIEHISNTIQKNNPNSSDSEELSILCLIKKNKNAFNIANTNSKESNNTIYLGCSSSPTENKITNNSSSPIFTPNNSYNQSNSAYFTPNSDLNPSNLGNIEKLHSIQNSTSKFYKKQEKPHEDTQSSSEDWSNRHFLNLNFKAKFDNKPTHLSTTRDSNYLKNPEFFENSSNLLSEHKEKLHINTDHELVFSSPTTTEYMYQFESTDVYDCIDFKLNIDEIPKSNKFDSNNSNSKLQTTNQKPVVNSNVKKSYSTNNTKKQSKYLLKQKLSDGHTLPSNPYLKKSSLTYTHNQNDTKPILSDSNNTDLDFKKVFPFPSENQKISSSVNFGILSAQDYLDSEKFLSDINDYDNKKAGIIDKINLELIKKQLFDLNMLAFKLDSFKNNTLDAHKSNLPHIERVCLNVYIKDTDLYFPLKILSTTSISSVLNLLKKINILSSDICDWAIYDITSDFFIERVTCFWECIGEVVRNWEPFSNNFLVVRNYPSYKSLSLLKSVTTKNYEFLSSLHFRTIKLKWEKFQFELSNSLVKIYKIGKNKKELQILPLEKYDIYTAFMPIKNSPTPYVFALKPELPMQVFEKPEINYIKYFCVQSQSELEYWISILVASKNVLKFKSTCQNLTLNYNFPKVDDTAVIPDKPLIQLDLNDHNSDDKEDIIQTQNKLQKPQIVDFDTEDILPLFSDKSHEFNQDIDNLFNLISFNMLNNIKKSEDIFASSSKNNTTEKVTQNKVHTGLEYINKNKNTLMLKNQSIDLQFSMPPKLHQSSTTFKKGTLLEQYESRKSKPVIQKNVFIQKKFTSGSLLADLPQKTKKINNESAIGKPLIDLGINISSKNKPVIQNSLLSRSNSHTVGVKLVNFEPLVKINNDTKTKSIKISKP
ncbi:hypothetical protein BB561_004199 [Smittium simulii]|uniref:PH domain-containing protein n=1 Tax=Smittium simulii TaxID=133385 RepID=A0A2T9YHF5_9FUNG|nr:hypothetical protein BB561_004199 [Smittium simulii]